MRSTLRVLAAVAAVALATQAIPAAWGQVSGKYRIELMSGRYVEGEVKELSDGDYEVTTKHGIIVTVKKSDVRGMRALDEIKRQRQVVANTSPDSISPLRRHIEDDEIEELLSGIVAHPDAELIGVSHEDMMAPLPLNEASLLDMMREAGVERQDVPIEQQDHVLIKDHFVMVYTSSPESARALGSRLEAVWRWNVKFMKMMDLPARRPESKLEIYYFADWEEFDRYARNQGSPLPPGVMGYYSPDINRSHFFDMITMPGLREQVKRLEEDDMDWRERQKARNRINQIVEFHNVEVIQHETGHHIHFNIGLFPRDAFGGQSVPVWLVEGTTMMFEVPPSRAGASLGTLNDYRLFHLKDTWGPHPLSPQQWKLFLIDNSLWRGFDSYQLGWAMVYYLWKEHRPGYAKYLQKVFGREEGDILTMTEREKEFEDCFSRVDDEWVEKFYAFLDGLHVRPSLLPPEAREQYEKSNPGSRSGREGDRNRGRRRPGGGRGRRR